MEIKSKNYGTPKHKWGCVRNWKRRGLIHDDFDSLYEEYINTTECQHCKNPFKSTTDRCVDHDHTTGLFRKIVCQKCNMYDSYIKYPTGYDKKIGNIRYYEANKTNINQKRKQKIECICGCVVTKSYLKDHKIGDKHLKLMDIYMNSVD